MTKRKKSDLDLALETRAVRAGRGDLHDLGVHAPPIDLSTTYPFDDLKAASESLDAMVAGGPPVGNPVYARLHNPSVARYEHGLAALEGTEDAVAFASGMAATTAAILAARRSGSHVVGVRPIYGSTDTLLTKGYLGVEVTWTDQDGVRDTLRDDTALVICETPSNPTAHLADIRHIVEQAGNVPVMVDSTFATPVLQNPAAQGAALVMHSATKYLGGHGDVMAGIIACSAVWAARLREIRVYTGANLHPLAAFMLHRGLPTLPLRVMRHQETALTIAKKLQKHRQVNRVFYPGLKGGDPRSLIGDQMRGPGPMLSFEIGADDPDGGFSAADRLLKNVRIITAAVSLGSVDSLIQHPAGLTHRTVNDDARKAGDVSPGLLRLSVGLEDAGDIWRDLEQALAAR
ncbi:PLP-dependent transferase [soil metagenome]